MAGTVATDNSIDVICQHTRTGDIIPLRIRLIDEDGIYQTFVIKAYRDISLHGDHTLPNNVNTHQYNWVFECRIQVFDRSKYLKIIYNAYDNKWRLCQ